MGAGEGVEEGGSGAWAKCFEICRSVRIDDCVDVRFQLVQSWDARSVSYVFDEGASFESADRDVHCGGGEPRRVVGWSFVWELVGTNWAAEGDRDCGAAGDSCHSTVGVLEFSPDARAWRISDAVHGARSVGCNTGALE